MDKMHVQDLTRAMRYASLHFGAHVQRRKTCNYYFGAHPPAPPPAPQFAAPYLFMLPPCPGRGGADSPIGPAMPPEDDEPWPDMPPDPSDF